MIKKDLKRAIHSIGKRIHRLSEEIDDLNFDIFDYFDQHYLRGGTDTPAYKALTRRKHDLESAVKIMTVSLERLTKDLDQ